MTLGLITSGKVSVILGTLGVYFQFTQSWRHAWGVMTSVQVFRPRQRRNDLRVSWTRYISEVGESPLVRQIRILREFPWPALSWVLGRI